MVGLIDFSQISLGSVFQFQDMLSTTSSGSIAEKQSILRHSVLTSIKFYKKKFGTIVLACDGTQYWRKQIFPYYKAKRKAARDNSSLDWHLIFDTISALREELILYFPYKVVHHKYLEGDDIIGTIVLWLQTNQLVDHILVDEKQPITIISSDSDFYSLHQYDNVQQFSPITKKYIKCGEPQQYLWEKIARGDTGDGIPNILSDDNVLVTQGVRQTRMTAKRLDVFRTHGKAGCQTPQEEKNWDRNNKLINLQCVPQQFQDFIIKQYCAQQPVVDKMGVFNYLVANNCRMLLDSLEDFF